MLPALLSLMVGAVMVGYRCGRRHGYRAGCFDGAAVRAQETQRMLGDAKAESYAAGWGHGKEAGLVEGRRAAHLARTAPARSVRRSN